jgi:hypothetical protein
MAFIGKKPANSEVYYTDPLTIDKSKIIYVRFDGINPAVTNYPVYFSTDDVFRNKVITGIDVWRVGKTPLQIQTDLGYVGTTLIDSVLKNFTITLVGKNSEILIEDMPLNLLINGTDGDFGKTRRFSMMIDLSKSYVKNLSYLALTSTEVIPITFYYRDKTI